MSRPSSRALQLTGELDAALAVGALVAELDAALRAPEDVGREHHEAIERVLIGHAADVLVDAEDLLEQHQARAAARRRQAR